MPCFLRSLTIATSSLIRSIDFADFFGFFGFSGLALSLSGVEFVNFLDSFHHANNVGLLGLEIVE
jgi:hypothetical protein